MGAKNYGRVSKGGIFGRVAKGGQKSLTWLEFLKACENNLIYRRFRVSCRHFWFSSLGEGDERIWTRREGEGEKCWTHRQRGEGGW